MTTGYSFKYLDPFKTFHGKEICRGMPILNSKGNHFPHSVPTKLLTLGGISYAQLIAEGEWTPDFDIPSAIVRAIEGIDIRLEWVRGSIQDWGLPKGHPITAKHVNNWMSGEVIQRLDLNLYFSRLLKIYGKVNDPVTPIEYLSLNLYLFDQALHYVDRLGELEFLDYFVDLVALMDTCLLQIEFMENMDIMVSNRARKAAIESKKETNSCKVDALEYYKANKEKFPSRMSIARKIAERVPIKERTIDKWLKEYEDVLTTDG